jgi:hypothetical protein
MTTLKNLWTDPMNENELIRLALIVWSYDYNKGRWNPALR